MRFTKTITAGVALLSLSPLFIHANARAINPGIVGGSHSKIVAKYTAAEVGYVEFCPSSYSLWGKRAIPKFGDDGDALGDAGAGEAGGATVEAGGTSSAATSDSGETIELGGVGGDDSSAGAAAGAEAPSSEDGSADSSSSDGVQSTSDDEFPTGPANKPVINTVALGYDSTGFETATGSGIYAVKITAPGSTTKLDVLEVDTTVDSIGVKFAINEIDNNPDRVPLRSILADNWQSWAGMKGRQMSDLKSVNYQTVVRDELTQGAFPAAYQAVGQTYTEGARIPLTLSADTIQGSAFNILMDTTFGGGAQKMLTETAGLEGRSVTSIDLFPDAEIDIRYNF